MNSTNHKKPLEEALSATAQQLMAAVQANADLGRELNRKQRERSREDAVIEAARVLKTAYLAYEERRNLLEEMRISPKEKTNALEPYRSEVHAARNRLFSALEDLDRSASASGDPGVNSGG
ncbi:MAG: hypothetical protein KY468_17265 [Armatimonadetes bacterium]|nr:hypothetical protein [Armatimonadota bacterium]